MSAIHSDDSVVLVQVTRTGTQVSTFPNVRAMVLELMDSGTIGGGKDSFYGSPAHIDAIKALQNKSLCVLQQIREEAAREKRVSDPEEDRQSED